MSILYKNFNLLLIVSQKLLLYILCNTHSDTSAEQNKLINYKFSLWKTLELTGSCTVIKTQYEI